MSAAVATPPAAEAAPEKKGKGKLIIIVVAVLGIAAAGYWFFLKPSGPPPPPEPGEVVVLEPIQVNLNAGHYLRLGLALQLTTSVAHEADGSKALDAAIEVFSGKAIGEVNSPEAREKLKKELKKHVDHDYHGDVMDVYFTEYVTQ
ncbi:flagellar basal body-associated protein FliL [Nocardioides sp.]|uniref:flagellar basal body-associated FliL family protein n=1 Tax=Nocardioides sp. TaxID=35761 RepID=UPI003519D1D3